MEPASPRAELQRPEGQAISIAIPLRLGFRMKCGDPFSALLNPNT